MEDAIVEDGRLVEGKNVEDARSDESGELVGFSSSLSGSSFGSGVESPVEPPPEGGLRSGGVRSSTAIKAPVLGSQSHRRRNPRKLSTFLHSSGIVGPASSRNAASSWQSLGTIRVSVLPDTVVVTIAKAWEHFVFVLIVSTLIPGGIVVMVATCCPNNAPDRLSARGASNFAIGYKPPPTVLLVVLLPIMLDVDRGAWPSSDIPLIPAMVVVPLGVYKPTVGADPLDKRDRERTFDDALGLADIVRVVGCPMSEIDGKAGVWNAAYVLDDCKDRERVVGILCTDVTKTTSCSNGRVHVKRIILGLRRRTRALPKTGRL